MSADFNETRVPTTDWQAYRGVLSRRVFAFLIDYAIIALLWVPAAVVVFFLGILTLGLGFFLYPALFAIVAMLYFGLTMGGPSQASAGMTMVYGDSLSANLRYTWFFGGGIANLLGDRDNVQINLSYDF